MSIYRINKNSFYILGHDNQELSFKSKYELKLFLTLNGLKIFRITIIREKNFFFNSDNRNKPENFINYYYLEVK